MPDAPGLWALPFADVAAWFETDRAIKEARRGERDVEIVVGCGPLSAGSKIPFRVVGYASAVLANIELVRRFLGDRAELRLRIFCSGPKVAALAGDSNVSEAFRTATLTLAGLSGALKLLGVRKHVRTVTIDASKPAREISDTISSAATYVLQRHPALLNTRNALLRFGDRAAIAANPLVYAIEHCSSSMFGDVDRRRLLHVTVGGAAEGTFWAARRTVVAIAHAQNRDPHSVEQVATTPALARIISGIGRVWYSPLPDEPPVGEVLTSDLATVLARLTSVAHTNAALRYEAKAAKRAAIVVGDVAIQDLARTLTSAQTARASLEASDFEIGPSLTNSWRLS